MLTLYRNIPAGLWRAAFFLCLAAVLWLALSPRPPQTFSTGWDKSNHALAFVALSFLWCKAYTLGWIKAWSVLLALGALIELLQSLVPNRFAEWLDLFADGVGIALGMGLFYALRRLETFCADKEPSLPPTT